MMGKLIAMLSLIPAEIQMMKDVLEGAGFGYQCRIVSSFDDVARLMATETLDILLADKDYPDEALYRKIRKVRINAPRLRVIMLADQVTPQELGKATEHFIEAFCQKNDDFLTLINTIEQVIT